ncbi:MAG TPA: hypothetical protein VF407_12605 [Polyangiaceae bacterium]
MRAVAASLALTALSFAAPAQAQRAHLAGPNEAYVLVEGPKTAVLERQDGNAFTPVCAAPCDRPFPIGATYRIAGEDVHVSEPFVLQGTAGSTITLHVDDSAHHTGAVVTQGGVIVTLLGGLTLVGGVLGTCSETGNASCDRYKWLPWVGGTIAVIGVATIVTGIVLMSKGSHAKIEQTSGALLPPAPSPAPDAAPKAAAFALPSVAPALPGAPTTPILTFSF